MKYVGMNEVVFDQTSIAFPGLGNCHGIVALTNLGMFGYHAAGNPLQSEGKARAFANFVENHAMPQGIVALYGLCPNNRYDINANQNAQHQSELDMIARNLSFQGDIKGFRWDSNRDFWDTAYVAVERNQGNPSFTIEDFSDGSLTWDDGPDPCPDKKVVSQALDGGDFKVKYPDSTVKDVTRVRADLAITVRPHDLMC